MNSQKLQLQPKPFRFTGKTIRLKSLFALQTSWLDTKNFDNLAKYSFWKWSILAGVDFSEHKDIFKKLRNYNSHYSHYEILQDVQKSFKEILKKIKTSETSIFEINVFFEKVFAATCSKEKSCNQQLEFEKKWLILLLFCSLFLYKSEFNELKNKVVSTISYKNRHNCLNIEHILQEFDRLIQLEKKPALAKLDKSTWAVNSINQHLVPCLFDKEKINLTWIVTFWNDFLLPKVQEMQIDFKLRRLYNCSECNNQLDDKSDQQTLNNREEFNKLPRVLRDQVFCHNSNCQNQKRKLSFPFSFSESENIYLIKQNVFFFKIKDRLFKIAFKTAKHLTLQMLLSAFEKNKSIELNSLKEQFEQFLKKCDQDLFDTELLSEFKESLSVSPKAEKLSLFKNRTFIKNFALLNRNQSNDQRSFDPWDLTGRYDLDAFWKNRVNFKIDKLQRKLRCLKKNQCSFCLENTKKTNQCTFHLPFEKLLKAIKPTPSPDKKDEQINNKQKHSQEIRFRLAFIFKTINSEFLQNILDQNDFDLIFPEAFGQLLKTEGVLNFYAIIEKRLKNKSDNASVLFALKNIPSNLLKFGLKGFDDAFEEFISRRILLIENNLPNLNKELFNNSVLKFQNTNDTHYVNKINLLWLKQCFITKEIGDFSSLATLTQQAIKLRKDFFQGEKSTTCDCLLHDKNTNKQPEKYLKDRKNWTLKLTFILKYCLQKVFENYFLTANQENKEGALFFSQNNNTDNFFKRELIYRVSQQEKIDIVFKNVRAFRFDLLLKYQLNKYQDKTFKPLVEHFKTQQLKFSDLKKVVGYIVLPEQANFILTYSKLFEWILFAENAFCEEDPNKCQHFKEGGYEQINCHENANKSTKCDGCKLKALRNEVMHRDWKFLETDKTKFISSYFQTQITKAINYKEQKTSNFTKFKRK